MPCMAGLLLLLLLLLSDRSLISYLYYEYTFRYIARAGRPTTMLVVRFEGKFEMHRSLTAGCCMKCVVFNLTFT